MNYQEWYFQYEFTKFIIGFIVIGILFLTTIIIAITEYIKRRNTNETKTRKFREMQERHNK